MRKGLTLLIKRLVLLALALCVLILYGCSVDLGTPAGEISEYDSVQFIPVDDNPSATVNESTADVSDVQAGSREPIESSELVESYEHTDYSENVTTQESGFVVSDKMYDFEGNNLVVVNVENNTNKNYSIYIHGQYLDENGKVLKEETKEFRGFAAGWKNNFFFTPGIPFAKFTYRMETKAYTGKCYGSVFSITYSWERKDDLDFFNYCSHLEEWHENGMSGDPPKHADYTVDTLLLSIFHEYKSAESIALKEKYLLLSSQGEILHAPDLFRSEMMEGDYTGRDIACDQRPYHCYDSNNAKLVERFESGEIIVLISIEVAQFWEGEESWEW